MVASIFLEGSGSDSDNLDDTDTKLYILGLEYKTPNSKLCEIVCPHTTMNHRFILKWRTY